MAGGFRGPNPNLQETTAMKTAITSKITLLNILRSRSTLILIAVGFMVFVLAQRTQAVNGIVIYCYPTKHIQHSY
jgi:hypothetical protein